MQRCVAPRRSALSLFLLPPSWNCTPGPSCTFARSDSAWLCAVRTKARVSPGMVCLLALCSGEPLRRAGNSSFQSRPSEKCDSHQWWENGPNKCTVASCETCFDEATRAWKTVARTCPVSLAVLSARYAPTFRGSQKPCISFQSKIWRYGRSSTHI